MIKAFQSRQISAFALMTVFALSQAQAAVKTVCPASYGSCNETDLQQALGNVSCGDELDLAPIVWNGNFFYGKDCSGNPVTMTSMRKAFLPVSGQRLSPSHVYNSVPGVTAGSSGNIPVLNTPNVGASIAISAPTKGLHMIGLGFTTTATSAGFTYILVNMEPADLTDIAQASDDIVLDRCYVSGPESAADGSKVDIQTGILVQGSHITVENSVIKDIMYRGFESHGIAGSDALGPVTYVNNFVAAAGISIFSGGGQPRYWIQTAPAHGVIPDGFTAKFNYLFKPHKWWNDPLHNPDAADFAAFGSYEPCVKNLGENKNGQNILWQYNVHENQWINTSECQGQSFGFTFTPRADYSSSGSANPTTAMVTSDTTLAYTPPLPLDNNGMPPQYAATDNRFVCPYSGAYFVCRYIQAVDTVANIITVMPDPMTGTGFGFTGPVGAWIFGWDASERVNNATVKNDVFRNVNKFFNFLAVDTNPTNGSTPWNTPGAVKVDHLNITNNLWANTMLMCQGSPCTMWGANLRSSENPYEPATRSIPSGLTWDHNTFYVADALNPSMTMKMAMDVGSWSGANSTPLDLFNFSNNILPPSANQVTREDAFSSSEISDVMSEYMTSNAVMRNNSLPGARVSAPCSGGQNCMGNINSLMSMDALFVNPATGNFAVKPGSALSHAGTDGADLGADVTQLALINNLKVTPSSVTVQFDWDLTVVNKDVPVVIEVSPSRALLSGVTTYLVVNDVNPVYFLQSDTDRRTNPKLTRPTMSGLHRTFVVGQEASVPDDNDGTVRDLRLTPGQDYYYRLQAGGDTQWGHFAMPGGHAGLTLDWPTYQPLIQALPVRFNASSVVQIEWDCVPLAASVSTSLSGTAIPSSQQTISFAASENTMTPSQHGLSLGPYQITVKLLDAQRNVIQQASRSITFVNADLSGFKVYPNPWRQDKHGGKSVTFSGLTVGTSIKLFTVSGHKIKELHTDDVSTLWDLTNDSGEKVASGIYMYLISDTHGDQVKGKLAVIK